MKVLRAGLGLASTLDLPRLGTSNVVGGDPVGVVGGGRGDGRARGLIDGRGFGALGAARGALLTGLAGLALLGEVGGDPDGVEEVHSTRGAGQEEEVQEETGQGQGQSITRDTLEEGQVLTPGDRRCWSRVPPR